MVVRIIEIGIIHPRDVRVRILVPYSAQRQVYEDTVCRLQAEIRDFNTGAGGVSFIHSFIHTRSGHDDWTEDGIAISIDKLLTFFSH